MQNKLRILKRLGMLMVLVLCLGFVITQGNSTRAAALPCCYDCPIDPDDPYAPTPHDYCTDLCGGPAAEKSCYLACLADVYDCWNHCSHCP